MNLSDGFVTYYIANIFFNIVFGYFYAYFLSSTRPAVSVIRYTLVLSFIVAPVSFFGKSSNCAAGRYICRLAAFSTYGIC